MRDGSLFVMTIDFLPGVRGVQPHPRGSLYVSWRSGQSSVSLRGSFGEDDRFYEDSHGADFDREHFPRYGLPIDDLHQVDCTRLESRYKFKISKFHGSILRLFWIC